MTTPRVLVVQNDPTDPIARLGDWLVEAGLDLRVVDGAGLPDGLEGYAGLVVLGGSMGAFDDADAPWLPRVRELLRAAVRTELPTLGICLGGQLLAAAHGGRIGPNPEGPEFGAQLVAKRTAAAGDPLFADLPITPDVIQWHYDAVTTLPAGAVELASSPVCANQAFRLGRLAWGVQFHIETTPEIVRSWAEEDAERLDGYDIEAMLSRSDAAHADLVDVWRPFAHAFAGVVRDPAAVAAPRGVPTSTAAPVTDPAAIRAALAAELNTSRASLPMPGLRRPGPDD